MTSSSPPKQIQCFNFDLDSVLYIPSEFLEATLLLSIKAMIQTGLRATDKEAVEKLKEIRSRNSNGENHFDQLCMHFNHALDPVIVAAGIEKYWDCKVGNMTSAPNTHVILNQLFQSYPLAIISNGPPIKQAGKIFRLGLYHYFSQYDENLKFKKRFFYATHNPLQMKPSPFLWSEAKKDIGFEYSRAVMVGDRLWDDIFGAKRLGMTTIRILQGSHSSENIDAVIDSKIESGELSRFINSPPDREAVIKMMTPDYTIHSLKELPSVTKDIEARLASR